MFLNDKYYEHVIYFDRTSCSSIEQLIMQLQTLHLALPLFNGFANSTKLCQFINTFFLNYRAVHIEANSISRSPNFLQLILRERVQIFSRVRWHFYTLSNARKNKTLQDFIQKIIIL